MVQFLLRQVSNMRYFASFLCLFISALSITAQTLSGQDRTNVLKTVITAGSEYLEAQVQDRDLLKHFKLDSARLLNRKINFNSKNTPLYVMYHVVMGMDTVGGVGVDITPELKVQPDLRTEAAIRGYRMLLSGQFNTDYRTAIRIAQSNGVKKGRVGDSLQVSLRHYRLDHQYPVYIGEEYGNALKSRLKGEYYWVVQDHYCTKCRRIIVDAADRNNFFSELELW